MIVIFTYTTIGSDFHLVQLVVSEACVLFSLAIGWVYN